MTVKDSGWQPLFEGEAAAEVRQTIEEIAAALAISVAEDDSFEEDRRVASLARGSAGHALFFDYAAQAFDRNKRYASLARDCVDQAVEAVSAKPMGYGLYSGFAGIAWVAEHLQRRGDSGDAAAGAEAGEGEGDLNKEIDDALLDLLTQRLWHETYDLIGGLVGLGVYALERLPRPSAAACLAAIVDHLAELAESGASGVTWFTPPELLGPWARSVNPSGHYNLGVAHGVPGILTLLAAACRAGIREEQAASLLEGGVRWLLAQQHRSGGISCFSDAVGPGLTPVPSRLAWCYGDAGVAAALLAAARLADRPAWELDALAIARRAAERPAVQSGVQDAGLCHGAMGLAHLFNRIYQATGEGLFAEAALFWYRKGLALRRPGQGVAGFSAWDVKNKEPAWSAETGFLTGAAGIGLALLAAVSPYKPEWDRVLLADIPARVAGSQPR